MSVAIMIYLTIGFAVLCFVVGFRKMMYSIFDEGFKVCRKERLFILFLWPLYLVYLVFWFILFDE